MTDLILVRHGPVLLEPDRPADEWPLAPDARPALERLMADPDVVRTTHIVSSPEPKAIETARTLAAGRPVEEIELLRELDRSGAGWVGEREYPAMVEEILHRPTHKVHGCETAVEAQRRAMLVVEGLHSEYRGRPIMLVSHGILLTLLLAGVLEQQPDVALWRAMRLPDLAVVNLEDHRLLRPFGAAPS